MSTHLHGDFLTRFAPRKRRVSWGMRVLRLLLLLVFSALAGWVWSWAKSVTLAPVLMRLPGLAVMPWPQGSVMPWPQGSVMPWLQGSVMGLLCFGTVAVLWKVALWIKRRDDETLERWSAVEPEGGEELPVDPLALPATGMAPEDLQRILASMIAEASEAREMAAQAAKDLSVEDYGDKIAGIHKRIHGVILCLGQLAGRVGSQDAPVKPDMKVSIKVDASAWQDSLRRNRDLIASFVSMITARATWVRGYHSTASGHRPQHGGYAS